MGRLAHDERRIRVIRWNGVLLGALVVLLLVVDVLAFHDIGEPHSAKDWLVLVASLLAIAYVVRVAAIQVQGDSRR